MLNDFDRTFYMDGMELGMEGKSMESDDEDEEDGIDPQFEAYIQQKHGSEEVARGMENSTPSILQLKASLQAQKQQAYQASPSAPSAGSSGSRAPTSPISKTSPSKSRSPQTNNMSSPLRSDRSPNKQQQAQSSASTDVFTNMGQSDLIKDLWEKENRLAQERQEREQEMADQGEDLPWDQNEDENEDEGYEYGEDYEEGEEKDGSNSNSNIPDAAPSMPDQYYSGVDNFLKNEPPKMVSGSKKRSEFEAMNIGQGSGSSSSSSSKAGVGLSGKGRTGVAAKQKPVAKTTTSTSTATATARSVVSSGYGNTSSKKGSKKVSTSSAKPGYGPGGARGGQQGQGRPSQQGQQLDKGLLQEAFKYTNELMQQVRRASTSAY